MEKEITHYNSFKCFSCQSCFMQLKNLEVAIHALISSYLDYCHSLYMRKNKHCVQNLQLAAQLIKESKKRKHVTPVLAFLHWLPMTLKIDFIFYC